MTASHSPRSRMLAALGFILALVLGLSCTSFAAVEVDKLFLRRRRRRGPGGVGGAG